MVNPRKKIEIPTRRGTGLCRTIVPPIRAANGDFVYVCVVVALALNGADGVRVVIEQKDTRRCARAEVRQRLVRVVLRAGAEEHGAQRE